MRKGATMPQVDTPWVGLAALVAMFVIPFLPNWLFEGPRTIRHRPRRHICADCGAPWTPRHTCELDGQEDRRPLQGQLRRIAPSKALVPRRRSVEKIGNF
jgi:hypothetical protein